MQTQILSPDAPLEWIVARLRESAGLVALLGDGPLREPGEAAPFDVAPIFQAGEVPDDHPARFVVVRPPLEHDQDYYADRYARAQNSQFMVYAETRSDSLPPGHDLDMMLKRLHAQIAFALLEATEYQAPSGKVWSCRITGAWTPRAILEPSARIKQRGVVLHIGSSV